MSANLAFSVKMCPFSSLQRIISLINQELCSLLDNTLRFVSFPRILPGLTSATGQKRARMRSIIRKLANFALIDPSPQEAMNS